MIPKKSKALLVSMTDFHPGIKSKLRPRKGAKKDTEKLHRALTELNYKVELHLDLDAKEILELYKRVATDEHGEYFVTVISSHGENGFIYGYDGEAVRLADIFTMFDPARCPQLANKPKIFFIQACRGSDLDDGVEVETDSVLPQEEDTFLQYLAIPIDTAVMFAASPGYAAFQNLAGSVFLQTLWKLLRGEERHLELLQLMTRINYFVAYEFEARGEYSGKKEMPCFVTKMIQNVFPFSNKTKDELMGLLKA
ncbi:caspase-3-like [Protopterus annectens]|uniref:caspase-3-like n=1 Tax=Protopterus annectens TaxID=7888 RepID=UPI001CFB7184|nr:caspase-3-like [Protopterus annectens]